MYPSMADLHSTDSTGIVIGVTYKGGVVLGADTRTCTGTYVSNRSDKTKLTDNVYLCLSGSAADSHAVADHARYMLNQYMMSLGKPATVKAVANIVRQISYNNKNMLQAGMIVAGWDESAGGTVYAVPIGGALIEEGFLN